MWGLFSDFKEFWEERVIRQNYQGVIKRLEEKNTRELKKEERGFGFQKTI